MRSGPASSPNSALARAVAAAPAATRPRPRLHEFVRIPFARLDAPPGVLRAMVGMGGEAVDRLAAEARLQPLEEPRPVLGFGARVAEHAAALRSCSGAKSAASSAIASTGCAQRERRELLAQQLRKALGVARRPRRSSIVDARCRAVSMHKRQREARTPAWRAASRPSSCTSSRRAANSSAFGMRHLAPAARASRRSARGGAKNCARLGQRAERAVELVEQPLAAALREPCARQPQQLAERARCRCCSENRFLGADAAERHVFERHAAAARTPQRGARASVPWRAIACTAELGEPALRSASSRPSQAAEIAQAAFDFEQQRLRRLERDPRRELAGPGGERLERRRRQGGKCSATQSMERSFHGQVQRRGRRRAAALEDVHVKLDPRRLQRKAQAGRRGFAGRGRRPKETTPRRGSPRRPPRGAAAPRSAAFGNQAASAWQLPERSACSAAHSASRRLGGAHHSRCAEIDAGRGQRGRIRQMRRRRPRRRACRRR